MSQIDVVLKIKARRYLAEIALDILLDIPASASLLIKLVFTKHGLICVLNG